MAPDKPETAAAGGEDGQAGLGLESVFNFHCQAGLACFNRCCRTPTVLLSPYDIFRLKNCLGISSGEFLERYTQQIIEETSNLPLVFLDPYRTAAPNCPFVGPQGCTVYPHRPAACRLCPITMGSELTAAGLVDHYSCRRLDYCRGFGRDVAWTVKSWKADQGFDEFDRERRGWLEILLRQGLAGPAGVDAAIQALFATAAYDLDRFRQLRRQPDFLRAYGLEGQAPEPAELSDLALVRFSYTFLKALLFPKDFGS